jgi:molecular chaperone GrpE
MNPQPEKTELEKKLEAEAARQAQQPADAPDADNDVPSCDEASGDAPADLASSMDVEALIAERDELRDQLLRARAEFDNYRKRVARDAEQTRLRAAESLLRDLLPVADNLELALQHAGDGEAALAEGIRMVVRQFHDVLRKAGVEPIPAVGEAFDPTVHEAVMQMPSADVAPNSIAQEFQKGYRLGEYVLRPSKVVVSTGAPEDGANPQPQDPQLAE